MARQCGPWRAYQTHEWQYLICDDPKVFAGKAVIRGTLIPVSSILKSTAGGRTLDQVMREYRLMRIQVVAALAHAVGFGGADRFFPLLA
jgi:uncharacterized protein (DUF433 family)